MAHASDWSSEVARRAGAFAREHAGALAKLALIPILLASTIAYGLFLLFGPSIWRLDILDLSGWPVLFRIIALLVNQFAGLALAAVPFVIAGVIIGVGLQRLILLGENPGWVVFRFRKYERAYALLIGLTALVLLAEFLGLFSLVMLAPLPAVIKPRASGLESPLGVLVLVIAMTLLYLHLRFALVYTHAAVTGQLSLKASWEATRNTVWRTITARLRYSWRMALTLLAPIVLIWALTWLAAGDLQTRAEPGQDQSLLAGLFVLANLAVIVYLQIVYALLGAFMYRDLRRAEATDPLAATAS